MSWVIWRENTSGKNVLKRKGIKLMWTTICEDCFDKIVKNHEEIIRR